MFSERSGIGAGETNAWTRALEARRAEGSPLLDLTLSNPTQAKLPYPHEALRRALSSELPTYEPDPRGASRARRALVDAGLAQDPERVVLTASTSEAYAYLFTLLADPGDEILVPAPSYPLLAHLAHQAGVHLQSYELTWDGRWTFDASALFDVINERTRAIVAVSPNNPTGNYLDRDELEALGALGLPLVVDEVFHAYPLEAQSGPRAFTRDECLVFSLDGLSKRAALPQLKLAWIVLNGPGEAVREATARLELIADTYLSPNAIAQHALGEVLQLTAPLRDEIRARALHNLSTLRALLEGTSASVPRVEGGWYAAVRMAATHSDEEHALALLDEGVLVHPGYFYDFPHHEAWLVLGLLTPPEDFSKGAAQVARRAR